MRQEPHYGKAKITYYETPQNKAYPGDQGAFILLLNYPANIFYKLKTWIKSVDYWNSIKKEHTVVYNQIVRENLILFSLTENKIVANIFNSVDNLKILLPAQNSWLCYQPCHISQSWPQKYLEIHIHCWNTLFSNLTLSSTLVTRSKNEGYSGHFIFGKSILTHFFKCSLPFLLTILLTLHTHPFRQVKMKLFHLPLKFNPQVFAEIKFHEPMASLPV